MRGDEKIENKKAEGESADRHTSDGGHWFAMTGYKKCGKNRRADRGVRPLREYRSACVGRCALTPPRWCGGHRAAGWGQPALHIYRGAQNRRAG